MLMKIAQYISIFMAVPVCILPVIGSFMTSAKTKRILMIIQWSLLGIQIVAFLYWIICLIG